MTAIWVSRPRRRAIILARELTRRNLVPILKPAMHIIGMPEEDAMPESPDILIFVSVEAVRRFGVSYDLLTPVPVLAVGEATLQAAKKIANAQATAAAGDTPALLDMPILKKVARKNIVVVGGIREQNRKTLSPQLCKELRERGARVSAVALYRRESPPPDEELSAMAADGFLCAAVAYSGDTAANMLKMTAPDNDWLRRLPLFVIHPQIVTAARRQGYLNPVLASAEGKEMAEAVCAYLAVK